MTEGHTILLTTILPSVIAVVGTVIVARIRANSLFKSKVAEIESTVDKKVLDLVKSVVDDMKQEMRQKISHLEAENSLLKSELSQHKMEVESLRQKLRLSDEIQDALRAEIVTLKSTVQWYKKQVENAEFPKNGDD